MSVYNEEHTWEQAFLGKRAAFTLDLCSDKCPITLYSCTVSAATSVSALQGSVPRPWAASRAGQLQESAPTWHHV